MNSADIPAFTHGGNIYAEKSPRGSWLDYSANINPLGLPESVKKTILEHIDGLVHYPDPEGRDLKQAISAHYGVKENQVILGNGAAELFYVYFHTKQPRQVLLPVPSFSEYEKAARCCGAEIQYFYLQEAENFQLDIEGLGKALRDCDTLILGNPNNPTGQLISKDDLVRHDPRKLARVLIALIYRLRLFGRGMQFFDYFFMRAGMKKLYKQK